MIGAWIAFTCICRLVLVHCDTRTQLPAFKTSDSSQNINRSEPTVFSLQSVPMGRFGFLATPCRRPTVFAARPVGPSRRPLISPHYAHACPSRCRQNRRSRGCGGGEPVVGRSDAMMLVFQLVQNTI
ncbi:hypothetical protein DFH06DRAFT_1159196 [Mycena polygramma]|nr:hypothetical protein DFH06DRAFT_1159196 [Mycena polygramma]